MPFRDVTGHRRLVELLSRSIQRGSLPPSLILAGPPGVGKRLVALATAQVLNCLRRPPPEPGIERAEFRTSRPPPEPGPRHSQQAPPLDACGECAACGRIARGVHPDILVVEPGDSGTIKIDQVRDVVERAGFRPFEGRTRVVIVDQADTLVVPAQNALLKILEEPPSSSVFLLVTSRPDVLLPTVRSRCPRLTFRPLPAEEIAEALVKRGRKPADAAAAAASADGSLARAIEASGEDLLGVRAVAQQVLARAAATPDSRRRIDSGKDLLGKTGKGGAADREQLASHLRAMASMLRDVEVLGTGAEAGVLANGDMRPALERLIPTYHGDRGVAAFQAIDRALEALDRNAGVKVVADWLVLQL